MKKIPDTSSKPVGIVSQIGSDNRLFFVLNNSTKCNISDVVFITSGSEFVLAKITEINTEFFLENSKQYFISKAVDNYLNKIAANPPRYAEHVIAEILGFYSFEQCFFTQNSLSISRYTPKILQDVYLADIDLILDVFGLTNFNNLLVKSFDLGYLIYPQPKKEDPYKTFFPLNTFTKHTLISGVTGSGKSRLAALIARKLVEDDAHVSLLDPHDEYIDLLKSDEWPVYKFTATQKNESQINTSKVISSQICFYEKALNAYTLTKLLPSLTQQQENVVYEAFNSLDGLEFSLTALVDVLIRELDVELKKEASSIQEKVVKNQADSEAKARNTVEFVRYFIAGFKRIYDLNKANRLGVLIAVIGKLNELRENNFITSVAPNWLNTSPRTIDIFNLDYSSNEYTRRFVNSVLQFFLRSKTNDKLRVLIIDEAHMLLKDDSQTAILVNQILREGRKFGIALVFLSQNTKDIPEDIRSQFQNHFMFREQDTETKYFPDQVCNVSLYSAKSTFAMKVKTIRSRNYQVGRNMDSL